MQGPRERQEMRWVGPRAKMGTTLRDKEKLRVGLGLRAGQLRLTCEFRILEMFVFSELEDT